MKVSAGHRSCILHDPVCTLSNWQYQPSSGKIRCVLGLFMLIKSSPKPLSSGQSVVDSLPYPYPYVHTLTPLTGTQIWNLLVVMFSPLLALGSLTWSPEVCCWTNSITSPGNHKTDSTEKIPCGIEGGNSAYTKTELHPYRQQPDNSSDLSQYSWYVQRRSTSAYVVETHKYCQMDFWRAILERGIVWQIPGDADCKVGFLKKIWSLRLKRSNNNAHYMKISPQHFGHRNIESDVQTVTHVHIYWRFPSGADQDCFRTPPNASPPTMGESYS